MADLNLLIAKYNRPGPRYTSYPPVPYWEGAPTEHDWFQHLKSNYDPKLGLDLYIHVPFCESLCYYCGCHRVITKDFSISTPFVNALIQEWQLYLENLGNDIKIHSLHFGGGTPTFLIPEELERLLKVLSKNFSKEFIGAIEVDPRTCQDEHLNILSQYGFKRISLGIQDFDPAVQKAIHRIQPEEMVLTLIQKIRTLNFTSINLDLIYGLPLQTIDSIEKTFEIVLKINPEHVSFYSYAHLPDRLKNQKLIKEDQLPSSELKRALFERGKEFLKEQGYLDIGMDHFAKPQSPLAQAKFAGKLKRNFMGYVDEKTSVLIGLGPSSISDSGLSFVQNEKDYKRYLQVVGEGHLPLTHGHVHNSKDLKTQKLNQEIMCNGVINLDQIQDLGLNNQAELEEFYQDEILVKNNNELFITQQGLPFVRNVAMAFDYRYQNQVTQKKFSQTI
jgi:oxygen-independent coproporphyrinogen-3 oxidase